MDIKEFVVMEAENRQLMVDPCKECKPNPRDRNYCQEKDPCAELDKYQSQQNTLIWVVKWLREKAEKVKEGIEGLDFYIGKDNIATLLDMLTDELEEVNNAE